MASKNRTMEAKNLKARKQAMVASREKRFDIRRKNRNEKRNGNQR